MSTIDQQYWPLVFLTSADDAILYVNHYKGNEKNCILIENEGDAAWLGMHCRAALAAKVPETVALEVV
jgi:hypothetical protein